MTWAKLRRGSRAEWSLPFARRLLALDGLDQYTGQTRRRQFGHGGTIGLVDRRQQARQAAALKRRDEMKARKAEEAELALQVAHLLLGPGAFLHLRLQDAVGAPQLVGHVAVYAVLTPDDNVEIIYPDDPRSERILPTFVEGQEYRYEFTIKEF